MALEILFYIGRGSNDTVVNGIGTQDRFKSNLYLPHENTILSKYANKLATAPTSNPANKNELSERFANISIKL